MTKQRRTPKERPNLISEPIEESSDLAWEHLLEQAQVEVKESAPPAQLDPAYLLLIVPGSVLIGVVMLYGALFYANLIFRLVVTVIIGVPFLWLLVSALRPAMPDRECPSCREHSLVLIDPQNEYGVRCLRCPHVDRDKRIPYLKIVMNDPAIAKAAGFGLDEYGEAQFPRDKKNST